MAEPDKLVMITKIAASYLRRNAVSIEDISRVISCLARAVDQVSKEVSDSDKKGVDIDDTNIGRGNENGARPVLNASNPPAVPIKKSVHRDYIVCLEDGRHARTLKRHLTTAHGMTPAEYREKWQLPDDYPIVAPAYSKARSRLAKKFGLGRALRTGRTNKVGRGRRNTPAVLRTP